VDLARQLASRYDLQNIGLRQLSTPVNDVIAVYSDAGEFALKLYHRNRGPEAVQWEADLLLHLHRAGAPVMQPIRGRNGYVEQLIVDQRSRLAVLSPWAAGSKPNPDRRSTSCSGKRLDGSTVPRRIFPPRRRGRPVTRPFSSSISSTG
jgi:Ser/Thr protein kinase RdoA (MazF antagonist)